MLKKKYFYIIDIYPIIPLLLLIIIICLFVQIKLKANLKSSFETQRKLKIIEQTLHLFKAQVGRYPTSEEGLVVLTKNFNLPNWKGPYIKKEELIDGWRQPYLFRNYFGNDKFPSFIASCGKNKKWDTSNDEISQKKSNGDDIIYWLE